MSLGPQATAGAGLVMLALIAVPVSTQQAVPATIFGTWIWNAQRQKIDSKLEVYRCYVEVLEDLGGGKLRMRDYRIRQSGQVVRNDVTLEFGRIYGRGGNATQWTIVGPRSYQMGPPDRDTSTGFVVTREIIEDGKVMRHVGEGMLNGQKIRNEQYFDRRDGPARSGDCTLE